MNPSTPTRTIDIVDSNRGSGSAIHLDEVSTQSITRTDQLPDLFNRVLRKLFDKEDQQASSRRVDNSVDERNKEVEELLQKSLEFLKVSHATQQSHINSLYSQIQIASELMTTNTILQRENTNPEDFERLDTLARMTHAGLSRVYNTINLRMDNERNILNLRYRAYLQAEHMIRQAKKAEDLKQQIAKGTYTCIHEEKKEVPDGNGGTKTILEQWDVIKQCDIEAASRDLIEVEMSVKASSKAIKDMIEAENNEYTKIVMKMQGTPPVPQFEDYQRPQRSASNRVPWQI